MTIIATPRLKLRKYAPEDLEALFALLRDEVVNTFLPWFPAKSQADAEAFYLEKRENPYFFRHLPEARNRAHRLHQGL